MSQPPLRLLSLENEIVFFTPRESRLRFAPQRFPCSCAARYGASEAF
jgi:hypothetical protein